MSKLELNAKLDQIITSKSLVFAISVFRTIPISWVYALKTEFKGYLMLEVSKKLTALANNRITKKTLLKKIVNNESYLVLSPKTHTKILNESTYFLGQKYRYWRDQFVNIPDNFRQHNFLMFCFLLQLWQAIDLFDIEQIAIFHDPKSRLFIQKKYFQPDILIKTKTELICVEADNGTEEHKALFDKFLRYFVYLNLPENNQLKIKLYFVFDSGTRFKNIFMLQPNVFNCFGYFNQPLCQCLVSKDKYTISREEVLQIIMDGRLEILGGMKHNPLGDYQKADVANMILNQQPPTDKNTKAGKSESQKIEQPPPRSFDDMDTETRERIRRRATG